MRRPACLLASCLVLLASCTAGDGVAVTLDEYSISARPERFAAGEITFTAHNIGAVAHQLLVLRTATDPARLPVDDGVVDVEADGIAKVGEIPIVAGEERETLTTTLETGRYALICNIAGHYQNGMRAGFRVT